MVVYLRGHSHKLVVVSVKSDHTCDTFLGFIQLVVFYNCLTDLIPLSCYKQMLCFGIFSKTKLGQSEMLVFYPSLKYSCGKV